MTTHEMNACSAPVEVAKQKKKNLELVRIPDARRRKAKRELELLHMALEYLNTTIEEMGPSYPGDVGRQARWKEKGVSLDDPQEMIKDGEYFNRIANLLINHADLIRQLAAENVRVIGRFKTSHRWALQNQPGDLDRFIVSVALSRPLSSPD